MLLLNPVVRRQPQKKRLLASSERKLCGSRRRKRYGWTFSGNERSGA
jgi:hypothetical protein